MEKRCIYILGLGGTIGSKSQDVIGQSYSSASIAIEALMKEIQLTQADIDIKVEQLFQKISHEITDIELVIIANKLNVLAKRSDIDGIIVVQGTNVIDEISYFMSLVIKTEKTIIFTGALRPYGSLGYDGLRNLRNALLLASDRKLNRLGIVLTFNDSIVSARDATKTNPSVLDDFSNNGQALMGQILGDNIHIDRLINKRHTWDSEFDINKIHKLPQVCVIYGHLGMDEIFIEAAISNQFDGIISAGMGKGYQSKRIGEALKRAIECDINVVRCSRTGYGYVCSEKKWEDAGFIAGGSLNPQKARILLLVALSHTKDRKELQRIFEQY